MKKLSLLFVGIIFGGLLNACGPDRVDSLCYGSQCPALQAVTLRVAALPKSDFGNIELHLDRALRSEEIDHLQIYVTQDVNGQSQRMFSFTDIYANLNTQDFLVIASPEQAQSLNLGVAHIIVSIQGTESPDSKVSADIQIQ